MYRLYRQVPVAGRYLLLCLYLCLWVFALFNYSSRCRYSQPDVFIEDWPADDSRLKSGRCYLRRDSLQLQPIDMHNAPELHHLETALAGPEVPAQMRLRPGGSWAPSNCTPLQHVAVMVAFRNRDFHLRLLLNRLHRMLRRQLIKYTVFVVEQTGPEPFNRGMLMNVGVVEALKLASFDCFIFHDVDMIPEHDRNVYLCDENARHLASAIDEMRYHVMFYNYLGAVLVLSRQAMPLYTNISVRLSRQRHRITPEWLSNSDSVCFDSPVNATMSSKNFFRINGFSNVYWGWGNEDDDISARTMEAGMLVSRPPLTLGRYKMVRHPKAVRIEGGYTHFMAWRARHYEDGLNALRKESYTIVSRQAMPLYTNISVRLSLSRHQMKQEWLSKTAILLSVDVLELISRYFNRCSLFHYSLHAIF
uniref:Beta-1,4-galactosyltransferase n=1 Tax=Macrostomum lignano TaxID=282301 RepID=A0A1I8GXA9_9PLAT